MIDLNVNEDFFNINLFSNDVPYSKMIKCSYDMFLQDMSKRPNKKTRKIFEKIAHYFLNELSIGEPAPKIKKEWGYKQFLIYICTNGKYYVAGVIGITKLEQRFKNMWTIEWVWIHPNKKKKGILKTVVELLEKKYGELAIYEIMTLEMECFARHYKKNNVSYHYRYGITRDNIKKVLRNKLK